MTALHDITTLAGALLALALLAGFASGLLGIGGGIFLVPAFLTLFAKLGFDSPQLMQLCVGTSTACVLVNTSRSAHTQWKRGALDIGLLRHWAPFVAFGAICGVLATRVVSAENMAHLFGVVGIGLGLSNFLALPKRQEKPPRALSLPSAVGLGSVIGFVSAMMGIGGGTLGVPAQRLMRRPIHSAVATSAAIGAILSLPATAVQLALGSPEGPVPPWTVGYVNLPAAVLVSLVSSLAIPAGVALAHRLPERTLRWLFGIAIILLSAKVLSSV